MRTAKLGWSLLLAACAVGFVADHAAAKSAAKLSSHWGTREIQADVHALDSVPVEMFTDDSPFAIGIYNDRDFLYLVLRTSDTVMRERMMRDGLVVWFDPKGGTKKEFGIQYPAGRRVEANDPLGAMELLGPGKDDRLRVLVAKTDDPKVQISSAEDSVTYQIKVPLNSDGEHHYSLQSAPGSVIGIGLATPEPAEGSGRPAMGGGGGRGGGGRGGRGGGGMGRRGGGGGGGYGQGRGTFEVAKPLKEWTTVKLAQESGA